MEYQEGPSGFGGLREGGPAARRAAYYLTVTSFKNENMEGGVNMKAVTLVISDDLYYELCGQGRLLGYDNFDPVAVRALSDWVDGRRFLEQLPSMCRDALKKKGYI